MRRPAGPQAPSRAGVFARWRRAFGVVGTLLLAAVLALLSGSALTSAGAVDTAHITGTVTGGGTAFPGIEVVAYRLADDLSWDMAGFTSTDALGQYDVGALAAGTYHVRFIDSSGSFIGEYLDDAAGIDAGRDVAVGDAATVAVGAADLAPAAHVTGTVTGSGGPLAGVKVEALQFLANPTFHDYWAPVGEARTNAAGHYDIPGLRAGTYRIAFTDYDDTYLDTFWGGATAVEFADDVVVAAGATVSGKDGVLVDVSHISGTVTGPDGAIAGVEVEAHELVDGRWTLASQATTDDLGGYDLAGLHQGAYRVSFDDWAQSRAGEFYAGATTIASAQDVLVGAAATTSGVDAMLAGGHIRGTITDRLAGPVDGLALAYAQQDGQWTVVGTSNTDADGNYDIAGLPADTYRVQLTDFGVQAEDTTPGVAPITEWWRNKASLDVADDVVLAEGATRNGIDGTLVLGEHDPNAPIANTALPVISGTPQVGQTLSASPGTWDATAELTHTYQWFANGEAISSATASTYRPTADVVGLRVVVRVTASALGRTPGSATSLSTPPIVAASAPSPAPLPPTTPGTGNPPKPSKVVVSSRVPRIVGSARVGQTLRLSPGAWSPSVVGWRLHWLADGRAVRGASTRTFVVRARQVGKRLTVRIVASAAGYEPLTVTTRPTARVKP